MAEVDTTVKVERVSMWRATRELFRDSRATWKRVVAECPTAWRSIRSGVTWFCLLLMANSAYWLFGGLLFASFEGWHESRYKCGAMRIRRQFIEELWEESSLLSEDDWRTLARQRLIDFEDQLHEAFSAGLTSYSGKRTWGFWDAVAFSMTTVSTIGYGHIVPVTWFGRTITICYSLFGIPLFLVLLSESGLLLTRMLKFYWVYAVKFHATASGQRLYSSALIRGPLKITHILINQVLDAGKSKRIIGPIFESISNLYNQTVENVKTSGTFVIDDNFDISAQVAIFVLAVYVNFGAVLFFLSEEWSPLESFYFTYVTLTTIGFGDYVPQHPLAILTSVVYIVFGLALTGLCLNTIQAEIVRKSDQVRNRLCSVLGLHLSCNEVVQLGPIGTTETQTQTQTIEVQLEVPVVDSEPQPIVEESIREPELEAQTEDKTAVDEESREKSDAEKKDQ